MRARCLASFVVMAFIVSCTVVEESDDDDASSSNSSQATGGSTSSGTNMVGVGGNAVTTSGSGGSGATAPTGETGKMVGFTAAHNAVRQPLGLEDLSWDTTVATVAQAYAETLAADNCAFEHSMGDYGENLYWSSGFEPTPDDVTGAWASEVAFYDYETNSCDPGEQCGHYTQIVWANTKLVGCGMAYCSDGSEVWVCNYDPPGNYVGQWPY